jgi:hypothetical protein
VKRFLRLFKDYRELEKDLAREAALADSMERYIKALEGRDKERLAQIEELEAKNRDALITLHEALEIGVDLRERLAALSPNKKKET